MAELLENLGELLLSPQLPTVTPSGRPEDDLLAKRPLVDPPPLLLFVARPDGTLLWADEPAREGRAARLPPAAAKAAAALARELSAQVRGKTACGFAWADGSLSGWAAGVRSWAAPGRVLLGGLFASAALPPQAVSTGPARLLACAFADAAARSCRQVAQLSRRVEHLRNEQQTLRASHAEALAAAISEREERLKEQQEHVDQLRTVMMMAADGIVIVDEDGRIESFNEHACSIFGYTADEVLGKPVTMLMPPELRARHSRGMKRWARKGGAARAAFRQEVTAQRKDGSRFPLDLAVSQVSLGPRRIFTGIIRDISQRKRAEEELRRLHMQNELILNSAGEGICGVDRQGRIIFANPAAARMLGWPVEELVGRPQHETIHHSSADGRPLPESECPICAMLAGRPGRRLAEHVFWRKDSTSFPVEYTCTPIDEGGRTSGAVVTFRDITERRKLEAQLRQAQKLESIGQLAAGIAHEINTPTQYIGDNIHFLQESFAELAGIVAQCQRLRQAAESGQQCREAVQGVVDAMQQTDADFLLQEIPAAIQQSLEGVGRVTEIVRSMKEFSHPGGEEKQAVDLNRAIESTLTISRNEWKYVADLVTQLDPDLPLVACLPGDVNQVILNLVVNAAHAIAERVGDSGQKGTITVSTRHDDGWVEIRVQDTGAGIPAAIRAKVFDPFFTTKPPGRGTGQGLAIAHSVIVEKHGGTISFETEEGRGTTFIIRLPVEPPQAAPRSKHHEKTDPLR